MFKNIRKNFYRNSNMLTRDMFMRRAFLKPGITKQTFWNAVKKELLNYYPEHKVKEVLKNGQILACLIGQPVEYKHNSPYNYKRKKQYGKKSSKH